MTWNLDLKRANNHECSTLTELQRILKPIEETDEAERRFQDVKKKNGGSGGNQQGNGGGNHQHGNGGNSGNTNNHQQGKLGYK